MRNNRQLILSMFNKYTLYALIGFSLVTSVVAGEHFLPAVKFLFQFFVSSFVEGKENYPEAIFQQQAILFIAKTASVLLVTLTSIVVVTFFFTPIIGFTQTIKELTDKKLKLLQTLRDYNKVQKDFINFSNKAENHYVSQQAAIERSRQETERLNIEISNTRHLVHNLAVTLNQLQAISEALGEELSPPEKTDQGGF